MKEEIRFYDAETWKEVDICDVFNEVISRDFLRVTTGNGRKLRIGIGDTKPPSVIIMGNVDANKEAIERQNRKWDQGKINYTLILPGFLELMAEILTKGEVNHPREPDGTPSWQLVEPEAYEKALFRHFQAYRKGEIIDTDPNMPTDHMGNIAVNAMFLWWFNRQKEKKGYLLEKEHFNED